MKERPIPMSAPMVRAILEGRKTQTRLVVIPQPPPIEEVRARTEGDYSLARASTWGGPPDEWDICGPVGVIKEMMGLPNGYVWRPSHGVVGDRLWVKESWFQAFKKTSNDSTGYAAGCVYRADDDGMHMNPGWSPDGKGGGWKSPRFMPRWASRITLEVTGVRVERVQDITVGGTMLPSDVVREGCPKEYAADCDDPDGRQELKWYRELWGSLNAKRSYGWDRNPLVWVYTFALITDNLAPGPGKGIQIRGPVAPGGMG